jgi:hypothetical protein
MAVVQPHFQMAEGPSLDSRWAIQWYQSSEPYARPGHPITASNFHSRPAPGPVLLFSVLQSHMGPMWVTPALLQPWAVDSGGRPGVRKCDKPSLVFGYSAIWWVIFQMVSNWSPWRGNVREHHNHDPYIMCIARPTPIMQVCEACDACGRRCDESW